ncbi:class I SAM-dependent methyltransferase [bacterium]|nr:class I SAM-dependent methyltransferase [bacterium]
MNDSQSSAFYDELAGHYDAMARFSDRLEAERKSLAVWQQQLGCRIVTDVGCGTGLHAIALSQLGLVVTAVDPAPAMLRAAAENAKANGVELTLLPVPMQSLHRSLSEPQDAVFCLGNTLPHLLNKRSLYAALKSAHRSLRCGGALVLQLINYERVLTKKERIVQISRAGETLFVRFYDFLDNAVRFNVLIAETGAMPPSHRLISTQLRPYERSQLKAALHDCGFSSLECYGALSQQPYQPASPNLVLCASKK